jgi:LuxR family maltose regulon positive regulatory protein
MPDSLLTTKLFFPPARLALVPRPRLVERLQTGLRGPLTLISAPTGYGKTTMVAEWRAGPGAAVQAAWLALDKEDNDPARFLHYLFACLGTLQDGFLEEGLQMLQAPQKPSMETALTILVNRLNALPGDFVLILDDYHAIENKVIYQGLAFLIDHLPPGLHLVLLTRADPILPLARLRAHGQLTEIRTEQLRFSQEEAAFFLNQIMGLHLVPDQVNALERRSEGWIAGLQLAALSVQGCEDRDSFIAAFTGSHHYIGDYLAEEVLNRQPPTVRAFLLETSILERLKAALCNAVTGREDGQAMLEKLEQGNLFLVTLDDQRGWFRYHHLFANLLQARLIYLSPAQVPELQRRAAAWCALNGLMEEAISYSLKARDLEQAAVWIEQFAATLLSQGRMATFTAWTGALSEEIIARMPRLGLSQAWALYLEYHFDQAEERIRQIEQILKPDKALPLAGELALWHGILARWHGDLVLSRNQLSQALELLPPGERILRGRAKLFLGMVCVVNDASQAEQFYAQACESYSTEKNIHGSLAACYYLANVQNLMGAPVRAYTTSQRALRIAAQVEDLPVAGYAHLAMAETLLAQNDLEAAAGHVTRGMQLAELGGHSDNLFIAMLAGARLARACGRVEQAQQLIIRLEELAQAAIPLMMAQVNSEQVLLFLGQGKTVEADEWLRQSRVLVEARDLFPIALEQISWGRVLLAQDKPAEALIHLAGLREKVIQAGMLHLAIQMTCLEALVCHARNQPKEALEYFREALVLAEPQNSLRVFLDQGVILMPLLQKAQQNKITPDFTARLVAAYANTVSGGGSSHTPERQTKTVLSQREAELLRLIASGCSNKEIAGQLFISLATVKRHTVNIFNKLDVKNRTEAVARARELGLL